jgi:hypothetical protein
MDDWKECERYCAPAERESARRFDGIDGRRRGPTGLLREAGDTAEESNKKRLGEFCEPRYCPSVEPLVLITAAYNVCTPVSGTCP